MTKKNGTVMEKRTKLNGNLRVIIGIVGLVSVVAAAGKGYTLLGAKADATVEHVEELKAEQFLQWIDIDANSDQCIRVEVQMKNIDAKLGTILEKVEKLHQ